MDSPEKAAPEKAKDLSFWQEMWQQAQLVWRLLRDPEVPFYLKLVPLAALIYIVFPLDLLPDLWPVLGQLDDVTALLVGAKVFIELTPPDIVARHMAAMREEAKVAKLGDGVEDAIIIDPGHEVKGINNKDRAG